MSACIYNYVCASCGSEFQASGVPEFSYGEFVMRSDSGSEAYLEAITNSSFNEVSELVESNSLLAGFDERRLGDITQKVFTVACDPTENGETFHIGLKPTCPSCSSREMASWEQVHPLSPSSIPFITHTRWESLDDKEKLNLVDVAIRNLL